MEGLDERLTEDGADIDAWLRLIRARMVLGEKDKAADALNRAAEALKDNPALIQLRIAEKWNGQLPQVSGGNTIPLLSLPMSDTER